MQLGPGDLLVERLLTIPLVEKNLISGFLVREQSIFISKNWL